MSEISFDRYNHATAMPGLALELAECFRTVFAERPWNEWKKCEICGTSWGLKDAQPLEENGFEHCGRPVGDYWPVERVLADLQHEITDDSSCWLAYDGKRLVGFCWGYPLSVEALEDKLGIAFATTLKETLGTRRTIAYQDELGVLSEYRGAKIAKQLFQLRHQDFLAAGVETGIVRTRELPEPSVTFEWFTKKLGYHVLARYPDNDGRVVLGQDLGTLDRLLSV